MFIQTGQETGWFIRPTSAGLELKSLVGGMAGQSITLSCPETTGWIAATDPSSLIHLVGSSQAGGLVHWYGIEENWLEKSLPPSQGPCKVLATNCPSERSLQLLVAKGEGHSQTWSLDFLEWKGGQWLPPVALLGSEKHWPRAMPFLAGSIDPNGMCHLMYAYPRDGGDWILYHTYRKRDQGPWGRPFLVSSSACSSPAPTILADSLGHVHLLWVDNGTGELKYRQRMAGGWPHGGWMEERVLVAWNPDLQAPVLLVQGEMCLVAWLHGTGVLGTLSQDNGKTWEPPLPYPAGECRCYPFSSARIPGLPQGTMILAENQSLAGLITPLLFANPSPLLLEPVTAPPRDLPPASEEVKLTITPELELFIQQHNEYLQQMMKQVEELRTANRQMERTLQEKTREATHAQQVARQQEVRFRTLQQQYQAQYDTLKLMEANLQRLSSDKHGAELQAKKVAEQAEGLREEIRVMGNLCKEKEVEISKLRRQCQEQERELTTLRTTQREQEREVGILKKALADQENRVTALLTQVQQREDTMEAMGRQIKELESVLQATQAQLAQRKPGLLERIGRVIQP